MAAKIALLVACLALSHAALVKRDAPATSPLEDLQKHAADFGKTFVEGWNNFINSKNTEQFNKSIKDGSETVLQQLSTYANTLQSAIGDASGRTKEALETAKANVERTAQELRQAHPEVEQEANQLKERIANAVQSFTQESQKLAQELNTHLDKANKEVAPKVKAAYDDFVKQIGEVQKKVQEAANKQ